MTDQGEPSALLEEEELPGLAGERTDLAWTRSGLAVLATVAVALKRAVDGLDLESASAIVLALLVALCVVWSASLVYAQVFAETTRHPARVIAARRMPRVAYGTTVFGVAAAVLAVLG